MSAKLIVKCFRVFIVILLFVFGSGQPLIARILYGGNGARKLQSKTLAKEKSCQLTPVWPFPVKVSDGRDVQA